MTDAEKIAIAKRWFKDRFGLQATVTIIDDYFQFDTLVNHQQTRVDIVLKDMGVEQ